MNLLGQLAAIVGSIVTIGGAAGWVAEPHVTQYLEERYATVEQVSSNSQAIMLVRIDNAAASGDRARLRGLCDDFYRLYGWTPSACR